MAEHYHLTQTSRNRSHRLLPTPRRALWTRPQTWSAPKGHRSTYEIYTRRYIRTHLDIKSVPISPRYHFITPIDTTTVIRVQWPSGDTEAQSLHHNGEDTTFSPVPAQRKLPRRPAKKIISDLLSIVLTTPAACGAQPLPEKVGTQVLVGRTCWTHCRADVECTQLPVTLEIRNYAFRICEKCKKVDVAL